MDYPTPPQPPFSACAATRQLLHELHANAPGPLAFSDKSYLLGILQSSGFSNSRIEVVKTTVDTLDTPEEDAALLMQIGFGARAVREAELDQKRTDELFELF